MLPDLPDLLVAIRAAGMVPNVTTNGTLHRADVIEALAAHAGVVHLSADRPDRLDAARGPGVSDRLRRTARELAGAGARLGVNLLLTPDNVADLRRSLDEALDLGAASITLLRPKGEWARANWPGFPSAEDLETAAADIRAFMSSRPAVRLYVDTAPPRRVGRAGAPRGPRARSSTAAEAGSATSPSPRKATSSPARTPDSPIIAWATS